jgi:hypothetical protein
LQFKEQTSEVEENNREEHAAQRGMQIRKGLGNKGDIIR